MAWLQTLDVALFRLINLSLSNPVLEATMPLFSGNVFFVPALVILAIGLVWKGGARGRLFVAMLILILSLGDALLINQLKDALGRARPFSDIPDVHLLAGRGRHGSMPSSHTSTWFAAAFIAFVYYRRSWRFMLPVSCAVGFSRIYVGVHYPSDVLAGAILGAGYAAAGVWGFNFLWQKAGSKWFPDWWRMLPSLLNPAQRAPSGATLNPHPSSPSSWLRLGYVLIGVLLLARLFYLASGTIELSEDESYQWLWSKHLALSYYSKPPLIAWVQFLGTSLWGDTAFGVRFFSPILAGVLSFLLLCFMAREVNPRAGFWLIAVIHCTPLLAVGATLMTVDPLLVLFWTAAMLAGWRAVQPDSTTRGWFWVGLWMGLGFLSKYTAAFQIVCWALFFLLWRPARKQLSRPGPYLALLINLLCTLPVIVWNSQHGWVTAQHLSANAKLDKIWKPTLNYFWEFNGAEAGLLNPILFVAALWATVAMWKRRHPLQLYFFSMGAPVFLGYWLYTLHSRVQPNWIAPAILPLFCLMVIYWEGRWRDGVRSVKSWLVAALALGFAVVLILHETNLIKEITGRPLPPDKDPLRRVRAVAETARVVNQARAQLLAEGKPVFIIGHHYGITGQISFYLPEARAGLPDQPLVYCRISPRPQNQFFFWPHYRYREQRQGENAIFVAELRLPKHSLQRWFASLFGAPAQDPPPPRPQPPPQQLLAEFSSVEDLGVQPIVYRHRAFRWVQLFACRELR